MEEALKKKSTRPLVNAMSKMLLEEENLAKPEGGNSASEAKKAKVKLEKGSMESVARSRVKTRAGVLVDWLESLGCYSIGL